MPSPSLGALFVSHLTLVVFTGIGSKLLAPTIPACPACPTCPTCPGCPGSPVTPATPATPSVTTEVQSSSWYYAISILVSKDLVVCDIGFRQRVSQPARRTCTPPRHLGWFPEQCRGGGSYSTTTPLRFTINGASSDGWPVRMGLNPCCGRSCQLTAMSTSKTTAAATLI